MHSNPYTRRRKSHVKFTEAYQCKLSQIAVQIASIKIQTTPINSYRLGRYCRHEHCWKFSLYKKIHIGPVYMRPERSQTGVKIKIFSMLHETGTKSRNIPNPHNTCSVGSIFDPGPFSPFCFCTLLLCACVFSAFRRFRTGLKCILCLHSCRSQFIPVWTQSVWGILIEYPATSTIQC